MCSLPPFLYFLQLRTLGTCTNPEVDQSEDRARFAYYEHLARLDSARRAQRVRSAQPNSARIVVNSATIRGNISFKIALSLTLSHISSRLIT